MQPLKPADYPLRLNFSEWVMLQLYALQLNFIGHVLFTDMAIFFYAKVSSMRTISLHGQTDNSQVTRLHAYQQ